jgi:hypothetical protein
MAGLKTLKERKPESPALRKQLDPLSREIENVTDAIVQVGVSPSLREKLYHPGEGDRAKLHTA